MLGTVGLLAHVLQGDRAQPHPLAGSQQAVLALILGIEVEEAPRLDRLVVADGDGAGGGSAGGAQGQDAQPRTAAALHHPLGKRDHRIQQQRAAGAVGQPHPRGGERRLL